MTTEQNPLELDYEEFEFYVVLAGCASDTGDVNGDTGFNVLDIVTLAGCVLNENCQDLEHGCAADLNDDGFNNILDIVVLAICILADNCYDIDALGTGYSCAGDVNGDSGHNVLDIVMLTNCILADNCDEDL